MNVRHAHRDPASSLYVSRVRCFTCLYTFFTVNGLFHILQWVLIFLNSNDLHSVFVNIRPFLSIRPFFVIKFVFCVRTIGTLYN